MLLGRWEGYVEHGSHKGCARIIDQLIAIRELERKLVAAFEARDYLPMPGINGVSGFRFRLAELNRWLDKLDRALDNYGADRGTAAVLPPADRFPAHAHR